MQRAHQHDADHRLKRSQRKIFGAGQKISGGVVHEHIERALGPDDPDHLFDSGCVAHIAGTGVDLAAGALAEFLLGSGENIVAAPADVDFGAQFQKPLRGSLAQAGAAAGDQDALAVEQIVAEHGEDCSWSRVRRGRMDGCGKSA